MRRIHVTLPKKKGKVKERLVSFLGLAKDTIVSLFLLIYDAIKAFTVMVLVYVLVTAGWLINQVTYFAQRKHKGTIVLSYILIPTGILLIVLFLVLKQNNNLQTELDNLTKKYDETYKVSEMYRANIAITDHDLEFCTEELYVTNTKLDTCNSQLKIQQEEDKKISQNSETAKNFLASYRKGGSPMKDYVDQFYKNDPVKGEIALAIAGKESAFGMVGDGAPYFNAWGYGCGHNGIRFSCGWESKPIEEYADFIQANGLQDVSEEEIRWRYAITRYMEETDERYLQLYDGSYDSVVRVTKAGYYDEGMDGATKEDIERWALDVYWFTQQF